MQFQFFDSTFMHRDYYVIVTVPNGEADDFLSRIFMTSLWFVAASSFQTSFHISKYTLNGLEMCICEHGCVYFQTVTFIWVKLIQNKKVWEGKDLQSSFCFKSHLTDYFLYCIFETLENLYKKFGLDF